MANNKYQEQVETVVDLIISFIILLLYCNYQTNCVSYIGYDDIYDPLKYGMLNKLKFNTWLEGMNIQNIIE